MFSLKKISRILIVLALSLLLATVALAQSTHKGGKLVVADPASNGSLDPFQASWHSWPMYAIYATLFSRDKDLNYVGFLADTWEASADGKTLTIHLIKNATFTDGTKVDGAAIKWNLDKYANKDTGSAQGADLIGLLTSTDVDASDPYTITLHLASSYAPLY